MLNFLAMCASAEVVELYGVISTTPKCEFIVDIMVFSPRGNGVNLCRDGKSSFWHYWVAYDR